MFAALAGFVGAVVTALILAQLHDPDDGAGPAGPGDPEDPGGPVAIYLNRDSGR